jgi:hypothetical protein
VGLRINRSIRFDTRYSADKRRALWYNLWQMKLHGTHLDSTDRSAVRTRAYFYWRFS